VNRIIVALSVVIALLALTEYGVQRAREHDRTQRSLLRPLMNPAAEVVPERVRTIRIHRGGNPQVWTYQKQGNHWRFPGHFNAYVRTDRIDFLLRSMLQTQGTLVGTQVENLSRYGLTDDRAVSVTLLDARNVPLIEVQVGSGVTGAASNEAYVRKSSVDSVLYWHANPLHALDGGNPPMIDPLVLPQALARSSMSSIRFNSGPSGSVTLLRRVEVAANTNDPKALLAQRSDPTIVWLATANGREDTCLNTNVSAYSSFLTRLRFHRVHDPSKGGYGFVDGRRLEIVDDDGTTDMLDVGGAASKQTVYLRNGSAGMVFSVHRSSADLLFPKAEYLFDPLPEPSPYDRN
jgi:hypothetical protein